MDKTAGKTTQDGKRKLEKHLLGQGVIDAKAAVETGLAMFAAPL